MNSLKQKIEDILGIPQSKKLGFGTDSLKLKADQILKVIDEGIGKDEPIPDDPNFDVVTYDSRVSPRNELREEIRAKLGLDKKV